MKIAVVHDWLVTGAGAEKVLSAILELYPQADLFSIVDFLDDEQRRVIVFGKRAHTTFIQRLPFAREYFRHYLALFPLAVESLDLRGYDLIISSSWACAKGVRTGPDQLHVCYCHTPIRYAWDLQEEYLGGLSKAFRLLVRPVLGYLRNWDRRTARNVDAFVANSSYVQERILRIYGRDSVVINPPVDTEAFCDEGTQREEYYFTASRLVPYKKTSLIVEAFNRMGRPLVVAGSGEELEAIRAMAGPNVTVLGYVSDEEMARQMQRSRAFVFAALEDFGIIPVEAMACGTPVIAYGEGGVLDSVVEGETGVLFEEQSAEAIQRAVERFETLRFDHAKIAAHARRFDRISFKKRLQAFIDQCLGDHTIKKRRAATDKA